MPGLVVTIRGDSAQMKAELASLEAAAKRAGATLQRSIENPAGAGGGHGGVRSGALRETLVLLREIGRGNWTRVPGSFSILVSQLGLLKYLLSPIALGLGAVGIAAYAVWRGLSAAAEAAKNFGDLFDFNKFSKQAAVMREVAIQAQEFDDWLNKLARSEESLTHKIEEQLRVMRERHHLQREIASKRGASELALTGMDIAQLQKEIALLDAAKKSVAAKYESDKSAAIAAENQLEAFLTKRKAMAEVAGESSGVMGRVIDAIKSRMSTDEFDTLVPFRNRAGEIVGMRNTGEKRKANANDVFDIEVEGKKFKLSLNQATEAFKSLTNTENILAAKQKELSDLVKDKKELTEKDNAAVKQLTEQINGLKNDLALKQEFGPQLAAAGRTHIAHGHLSSNQQIGAYSPGAVQLHDVAKQSLHELKGIHGELKKGNGPIGGGSRVKY